jgi:ribosomal protein S18 acetylase RimI-like enzyme
LLHDAARNGLNLLIALDDSETVGAMLMQTLPGGTGIVWPPATAPASRAIEDKLIVAALAWLRERGARLSQALLDSNEVALAEPLRRHSFANPTRLWYLRHNLDLPLELLQTSGPLAFQSYRDCNLDAFYRALLLSYRETKDFPELNGLRSLEEVLRGHKAAGFDPNRWWLASEEGRAVGVLLLSESDEAGEWEIAYVGIVPDARQRGLGTELVRHALCETKKAGMRALTLSLDARNEPAWKVYRKLGFEPFAAREVFLLRIQH